MFDDSLYLRQRYRDTGPPEKVVAVVVVVAVVAVVVYL